MVLGSAAIVLTLVVVRYMPRPRRAPAARTPTPPEASRTPA